MLILVFHVYTYIPWLYLYFMQMSTPSNAEQADAQIGTRGSDSSGSEPYRSPSVSPRESPRAKKARLELERDPNYEPEDKPNDDEVYMLVDCLYERIMHVYVCT